jgi:hypothetical protein
MPKYQFVNPGAAAGDALSQALLQRELQKRQAMLDDLNKKQTEAQIASGQETNRRLGEQFDYSRQRDATEDQFRDTQARTAAQERTAAAEADRAFKSEQADLQRQSAADQKDQDRELKELLARMSQSGNMETRALANELKRMQITALQDKGETAKTERSKTEAAKTQARDELFNLAQGLMDDPQLSRSVGVVDSMLPDVRPEAKDFTNRQKRLKALLSLEGRSQLKGTGAISDFESKMLEASATSLDSATDEGIYKKELQRILGLKQGGGTDASPAGTGTGVIRQRNSRTGQVRVSHDGGQTWSLE